MPLGSLIGARFVERRSSGFRKVGLDRMQVQFLGCHTIFWTDFTRSGGLKHLRRKTLSQSRWCHDNWKDRCGSVVSLLLPCSHILFLRRDLFRLLVLYFLLCLFLLFFFFTVPSYFPSTTSPPPPPPPPFLLLCPLSLPSHFLPEPKHSVFVRCLLFACVSVCSRCYFRLLFLLVQCSFCSLPISSANPHWQCILHLSSRTLSLYCARLFERHHHETLFEL